MAPGIDLQQAARDHLWLHFTRMGGYGDDGPIIVRGDGCYLEDANGKRYLDALAGLFAVQIGYSLRRGDGPGGARADARAALLHELVVRASARDRARARGRVARAGRPQPRLLRLRRLGGGRVGVEARAPVPRRARRAPLEGRRAARSPTTARRWARSRSTASPRCGRRSSRSCPTSIHVRNTNRYHRPARRDRGGVHRVPARGSRLGDRAGRARDGRDGDHGAGAERRRLVHAAGRLLRRACARSATATGSCSAPTR